MQIYTNARCSQIHLSSSSTVKEEISNSLNLNGLIDYNSTIYLQIEILNKLQRVVDVFFNFSTFVKVKWSILIKN